MSTIGFSIAVACGVMAGVFFAFSSFVMTALGNLQPGEGIRAMQRINVDVFCWSFSLLFFGIPVASLGLGVYAAMHFSQAESVYFIVASIVYLAGSLLVTIIGNVPLNDALARLDPEAHNANDEWRTYLVSWTRWNHVRAGTSLIACVVFLGAILGV